MTANLHKTFAQPEDRPDFMVLLGLAPPYDVETVKQAYLEKARQAHPDRGGKQADFVRLQEAFERATQFAEFKASRLRWLGAQVERYARQERFVAELRGLGAQVETERIDWLRHSFGDDFAQVAERVVAISLNGPRFGDDSAVLLASAAEELTGLATLDFSGSQLTDHGVERLAALSGLRKLNLSRTAVTNAGLASLARLTSLHQLGLYGTRTNWWGRWRLRRALKHVVIDSGKST